MNRNNHKLAQNNISTFSTLGRRPHNHNQVVNNQMNFTNELIINNNNQTLNRNRYTDLPIANPLFNRYVFILKQFEKLFKIWAAEFLNWASNLNGMFRHLLEKENLNHFKYHESSSKTFLK